MAERPDAITDKPMRLSDVLKTSDLLDEPQIMRLGDVLSNEKIDLGPDFTETGVIEITDSQRKDFEKMGPIGYAEQTFRQDKTEMLPFNPEAAVKSFKLLNAVKRMQRDEYGDNPQQRNKDLTLINNFLFRSEEERVRGYTIGGRITQGVAQLPGYMLEFLATGGAASIGKKGVEKLAVKTLGDMTKRGALKFSTRIVGKGAGAVIRTGLMPHRVAESFAERQLNSSLELTDKGLQIAKQSREKPSISVMKAYGDIIIENFSEELGPEIAAAGKRLVPRKMATGIAKLFKNLHPNENVAKIFTRAGYDGFLEELGEERVGALLRAITGVEDFGAEDPDRMFDRIVASIPNGEELLVEAGVLAFPGLVHAGAQQTGNIVRRRKVTERPGEIIANKETGAEEVINEEAFEKEIPDTTIEEIAKMPKEAEIKPVEEPAEGVIPEAEKPEITLEEAEREAVEVISKELAKTTPITKESVKKALDIRLEQEVRELEEKEEKRLSLLEKAKIELKNVEATIKAVRETPEFTEMGENIFEGKQELIKDLIAQRKTQQEKISKLQPEKIARTETDILKEKLQNIQRGIREGKALAKEEVKGVQDSVIKLFKEAELDIPVSIKNIQTQEQLIKVLPDIRQRIARLEVAAEKRDISAKIKKELKTTKPLKVGQKRVGKFDFETNKMFDTLRDFNKLTQEKAQAEFDKFPEEGLNDVDLIKKRFLSLKANGASASAEIHSQVLADIKRIKELGKKAKDDADLEKRLNRQETVESTLSSIDKIKADKKTVKTKIGNVYRKGFSNIYSMLNSIGGKDFAEIFDPELSENRRNTAIYRKTLDVTREASKIYNEKNIMRMFETMSQLDYEITDVEDGLTTELSKLELIDIYNSIKNDKKKQDYFEAFGEDQVETLMRKLTPQDEAFGDSLQETVQGYREILNKRNIEITGRDLGFVENYWPATSEFKVSVIDDLRIQGETPSALKERAKAKVIPVPKNAWYKAQRHISQAEHVDKISREFETLKRLFNDRKVKHAVMQKYGDDVYDTIIAQIDNISLNKQTERIDAISSMFQKAINNWVTAKIALNPSTYVRQLMSVGNYAENMNVAEWTTGFFKGIASPKETFKFVWENAPFLEARFNKGFSEALKEAIEGAERISVNRRVWTKFLTALVRSGDVTAIIYGGFPLIKSELAKGKSMKEAIDTFERATLKAQQSGLSTSVSQFQNSRNPFTRLFLAFKNTVNQFFRKQVDSVISFQNKDISLEQFAKTMTIYAVIQPILYVSAGFATKQAFGFLGRIVGLREDDEDFEEAIEKFLNDVMIQLIVSPVNAMPIIDDVIRTAARKLTGQKIFKVFSTPLFDDLENGLRALTKKQVTGGDYLKTSASILEPATGVPIATGIRFFEILTGKKIGEKQKSGRPKIGG